jgi:NDP-sugar pyrophosphorylase family protein
MKAMIFAAGLGTRLKPLTNNCPKALVKLNGQALLWHAIRRMTDLGASSVVVNIHHFGEQIIGYLQNQHFGIPVLISDERHLLLDTGGGLLKAAPYLKGDEPIIACNVDVISSVNLHEVMKYHQQSGALASLVLRQRETSRYLLFDDEMLLSGWMNKTSGEQRIANENFNKSQAYAFSGIQILSPEIFELIHLKGKFSLIDLYLELAAKHPIAGYIDRSDFWLDVGKAEQLQRAEAYLKAH